jgi:hypothetical protein
MGPTATGGEAGGFVGCRAMRHRVRGRGAHPAPSCSGEYIGLAPAMAKMKCGRPQ